MRPVAPAPSWPPLIASTAPIFVATDRRNATRAEVGNCERSVGCGTLASSRDSSVSLPRQQTRLSGKCVLSAMSPASGGAGRTDWWSAEMIAAEFSLPPSTLRDVSDEVSPSAKRREAVSQAGSLF